MRYAMGVVLMAVACVGCSSSSDNGGGGGGGPDAVLEGRVFDCVAVANADIELREILPGTAALGDILGSATTDNEGRFTANIPGYTGFVHADATGGTFADPFQGSLGITNRFESIVFVVAGETRNVVISASTTVAVRLKFRLGRDPGTDIATDIYNTQRIFAAFTGFRGDIFTTEPDFQPSNPAGFDHLQLNTGLAEWAAQLSINPSELAGEISKDAADYELNGQDYDEPLAAFLSGNIAQQWGQGIQNGGMFLGYDLSQTNVDDTLLAGNNNFIKPPWNFVARNLYDTGDGNGQALIWGAGLAADNDVWFVSRSDPTVMMQADAVTDEDDDALGVSPPAGLTDLRYDIMGENVSTGIRWYVRGFRTFDPNAVAAVDDHQPKDGPIAGGTRVRFRGADLHSGTMVRFNGIPAVHTNSKDGEWIECATPAGLAGDVDITLTNPSASDFTISAGYRYLDKNVGLTEGFGDEDQISVSAKFSWNPDFTVGCTRFLIQYTNADAGTFEGPAVTRSMMAPDPVTQLFDASVFRVNVGRDAVNFTIGEGFNRYRVSEKTGEGYGLRDNGIVTNFVAPTNATNDDVDTQTLRVYGFMTNVVDKEFTTLVGTAQLHDNQTGEISGTYSTRKTQTGDVEFGAVQAYIPNWTVDSSGLLDGEIDCGPFTLDFNGQLDDKFRLRYAWGGDSGRMVLLYLFPVGDGIEPQDASGNWVSGDFLFDYNESFSDNFSIGASLSRFTVGASLNFLDTIERVEGDVDRTADSNTTRFDESLRHSVSQVNSFGEAFDSDSGERLTYFTPRFGGFMNIVHPDEDGDNRTLDFRWGAGTWVPERYTADSIRGVHHKASSAGFSPVISDPPDLSRFYTLRNTTRDFDPTAHLDVDGRDFDRTGTLALNQLFADVKRADRVSTGEAFFFRGTEGEPETTIHYMFQDEDLLLFDALFSLGTLRKGAVTADCATVFTRDFGTGGTNNFLLFAQQSATAPPCANQTYCIGGIFVEFDDDNVPAGATVQTIRGEVQLDVPTPGAVTLELNFFRKAEDGNEEPPSQETFVGTYTCDASGNVAINIPGEDGDPDIDLEGFATPDGEMIYLHDRSAIPQVGIAMAVKKGPGTPALIDYNVAGIDLNFLDGPSIPRRTNLIFSEAVVTTSLPGGINLLGTSRTRGNFMTGVTPGQTVFQATLNSLPGGAFEFTVDPAASNQRFLGALSTNGRFGFAVLGNPNMTDTSIRFFFPK